MDDGSLVPLFDRFSAELDAIVDTAVARVRAEIPEFAEVPPDALREGLPEAFALGVEAVRDRRPASPGELKVIAALGARRADQGFPLDVMLRASRSLAWSALDAFEELAAAHGTPPDLLRETVRRFWRWADSALFASATGHHERLLESARDDARARADLVRHVLRGTARGTELRRVARRIGLDPDARYLAVRARPLNAASAPFVERAIADGGSPPLLEHLADEVIGITARVPDTGCRAYVGVGGPVPLDALTGAFVQAARALETAVAFDLRSPVRPEDRPLELAVAHDRTVGAIAEKRCLGPFGEDEQRRLGLVETLGTLLDTGLNVRKTAARLHVHPNTVRYRLHRFEEGTGLRLALAHDAFLLWWALGHREIRRRAELRTMT